MKSPALPVETDSAPLGVRSSCAAHRITHAALRVTCSQGRTDAQVIWEIYLVTRG